MKLPKLSIKIGTASKIDLFKLSNTVLPPAKETSRSLELPPKKIPIRIYANIHLRALDLDSLKNY
jgi:hypothetical protein